MAVGVFLNSPNEISKLPADDRIESRQLTAGALASEYEAYSNQHNTCSSREWHTYDGTSCSIEFLLLDVEIGGEFAGNLYGITFTLTKDVYDLSEDFKMASAQNEDIEPPNEENLVSLKLIHVSEYLISQSAEFGWTKYNYYESNEYMGSDDSGPIYSAKVFHATSDIKLIDIPNKHYADIENDAAGNIKEILKGISNMTEESLDKELRDCIIYEAQLKRAYELLLILQGGDETGLDISSVTPATFLE